MPTVRTGPVIGLVGPGRPAGGPRRHRRSRRSRAGWPGSRTALGTCAALTRGMHRSGASALGPADRVTLARATPRRRRRRADRRLVPTGRAPVALLVTLTVVALVLDGVDGQVARRTGTATAARRALRHGGRRLPHARAQRLRRPPGRRVGARDRRDAVRVRRGELGPALDARRRCRRATGARWSPRPRASCWSSRRPASCRRRWPSPRWRSSLALLVESFGRDVLLAVAAPAAPRPYRAGAPASSEAGSRRGWRPVAGRAAFRSVHRARA